MNTTKRAIEAISDIQTKPCWIKMVQYIDEDGEIADRNLAVIVPVLFNGSDFILIHDLIDGGNFVLSMSVEEYFKKWLNPHETLKLVTQEMFDEFSNSRIY